MPPPLIRTNERHARHPTRKCDNCGRETDADPFCPTIGVYNHSSLEDIIEVRCNLKSLLLCFSCHWHSQHAENITDVRGTRIRYGWHNDVKFNYRRVHFNKSDAHRAVKARRRQAKIMVANQHSLIGEDDLDAIPGSRLWQAVAIHLVLG